MSIKDTEERTYVCDTCKTACESVVLPDGWQAIAERGRLPLRDETRHFCSGKCAQAYDARKAP